MEFDELPTHIQEQWEQSEQFGDELRMIRTLRAGKHGEWAWSKDKSEFTADAIKKIERHRRGFFHPHEAAAEISRLKPFEEAAERKLLTKIVDDIKTGIIPIYREPLMFKETFTTGDKYSELEILLNASDLNEWLKSRNTDLQLMVPKQSAVTNLQLTAMQPLSTPQPAPASEPVTLAAAPLRTNDEPTEWIVKSVELANAIGLTKWMNGERQITARNIANAVAVKLGEGEPREPQKYHGNQGPRSAHAIRSVALKGWKFICPSGIDGINGMDEITPE